MRRTILLAPLAVLVVAASVAGFLASAVGEDGVTTRAEPTTRLYVKTLPPGAKVKIDGKESGVSDQLFRVSADAKRVLIEVELNGCDQKKEVIVRGGRITRVEFDLQPRDETDVKAPVVSMRDHTIQIDVARELQEAKVKLRELRQHLGPQHPQIVDLETSIHYFEQMLTDEALTADAAPRRDWGPEQATGAPNTPHAADWQTAWASLTPDDQQEWLLLDYAKPVRAKEILVHESFNPGALSKITAFDPDGKEVTVWQLKQVGYPVHGPDGEYSGSYRAFTKGGVAISKFPVKVDFPIQRIKLYLDSPRVKGWNEIDAVGLVEEGKNIGVVHWATKAEASSTYATKLTKPAVSVRPQVIVPEGTLVLGDVAATSTDKRSLGGSGHAVQFQRSAGEKKHVFGVQIYASRYGSPQPPAENFHVYLLDEKRNVIKDFEYPYGAIQRTGEMQWYTLNTPPTEVPERFYVALSFNPHRTKGIYLGIDKNVSKSHSYIGLPGERGFKPVDDGYEWMVRALLTDDLDSVRNLRGGVDTARSKK